MASAQSSKGHDRGSPVVTSGFPPERFDRQGNLSSFKAIAKDILRNIDQQIDDPGTKDHEMVGSEKLKDIRTRFLLWCGNLGVMHEPDDPRALDKRLLGAKDVGNRVHEVLKGLQDLLNQSMKPCNCDPTTGSAAPATDPDGDEDAMMMQLLGLQTSPICRTSWLSASLDDSLRRLFHLSSLITKSSTRDKFARAEVKCRLQMYETYDIQHIHEKVKHASGRANDALIRRVGKANTSRRQFITYSRNHAAELGNESEGQRGPLDEALMKRAYGGIGDRKSDDQSDDQSLDQSLGHSERTKRSEAPTKASTIGLINADAFDYGLDDARSSTTVATSIVDGGAFSGLQVSDLTQYTTPGQHFICPICQTVQHFNAQMSWRRHVFSDLRAYICTSTKCGMLMFGSFNAWRSHEMDHRREWVCPVCDIVCQDRRKAQTHLSYHHAEFIEHRDFDILLQTSSRLPENLPASECPFCDWNTSLRERNPTAVECDFMVPSKRFMRHLGRHLEEIALFVVPLPEENQNDPEEVGSNAVHYAQDVDSEITSTLSSFRSRPPSVASVPSEVDCPHSLGEPNRGLCPCPNCGRLSKDAKAHMIAHQSDRPWKCPILSCKYHAKGFAREYDRRRHTLTHYKGTLVCGFCPDHASSADKSFNRAEVFKRHLTGVHGVEQTHPNAHRQAFTKCLSHNNLSTVTGNCSTCDDSFTGVQEFYEHLDDCVLRVVEHADPSEVGFSAVGSDFPQRDDETDVQAMQTITSSGKIQPLQQYSLMGDTTAKLLYDKSPVRRWLRMKQRQEEPPTYQVMPQVNEELITQRPAPLHIQEETHLTERSP